MSLSVTCPSLTGADMAAMEAKIAASSTFIVFARNEAGWPYVDFMSSS